MPSESLPSPWKWTFREAGKRYGLLVGSLVLAVTAAFEFIARQDWVSGLIQGAIITVVVWLLLVLVLRTQANRHIARERARNLAAWRSQFLFFPTDRSNGFGPVLLHLVLPHGSSYAAFRVTVRDPNGVVTEAKHVGSSAGYDEFPGSAGDWEYPSSAHTLPDGVYTATWYERGHAEPIGEETFKREAGRFLVEESSDP